MESPSIPSSDALPSLLLDLPPDVLDRRLVERSGGARDLLLALFRTSRALARTVLLRSPGSKRLSKTDTAPWSPTVAGLLDDPLLHALANLELHLELPDGAWQLPLALLPRPPPPPPPSIAHHVARLEISKRTLTTKALAAWRLHDAELWPHLKHLEIDGCPVRPPPAPAQPLQPIPRLQTFTWYQSERGDVPAARAAVLPLAGQARHLRIRTEQRDESHWPQIFSTQALEQMPHLTHADLNVGGTPDVLEALLRHPALEHVTLRNLKPGLPDLRHQRCRWRTLTVHGGVALAALGRLPLGGLECLSVSGGFSQGGADEQQLRAGLAALQWLDGAGKLGLPSGGFISVCGLGALAPDVLELRLAREAGARIDALFVDTASLDPAVLERRVAPLLQRHAGRVTSLSVDLTEDDDVSEDLWGRVLGLLPPTITRLQVQDNHPDAEVADRCLVALVRGGFEALRHPLTLTVAYWLPARVELEMKLGRVSVGMPAVPGEGGGPTGPQLGRPRFLTLRVVKHARPAAPAQEEAVEDDLEDLGLEDDEEEDFLEGEAAEEGGPEEG